MIFQFVIIASLLGSVDEEKILINNILEARTEKSWTLDRLSNKNMVSVAATGTAFYAYAKASQLSMISKETATAWIRQGFDEMLRANINNDGWLYHFLDLAGKPYKDSEVSSIDSVIFYCGAERAAQLLNDEELLNHIKSFKEKISVAVMTDEDGYFYHGWNIEDGKRRMLKSKWKHYNEGILIYKYFNKEFEPKKIYHDLPLFVYFYPLAFYQEEFKWSNELGRAIRYQLEETGRFGYSAMDGRNGYVVNSPYFISPLAIYSCYKYFPKECKSQLNQITCCNRLTQSVSVNFKWISKDRVLLDDGIALMLIGKGDG